MTQFQNMDITCHKWVSYQIYQPFWDIKVHINFNSSPPSAAYYASVNWVSIGSDNDLTPVRHQAITWTNAELMST